MKLVVERISKRYRSDRWGLREMSVEFGTGVVGLLGPNGAGKSTLMRILATVTKPTTGRVLWNNVDTAQNPEALRAELGYLPQDFGVYPHLSALEFLDYMAAAKGLSRASARQRIAALLELLNLTDAARRQLGTYSGGMRQRVGIATALLNDPRVLIMDEPSVGLDPEERVGLRVLLSDLSADRLIILSTHVVSDVEAIARELVIIAAGRLVLMGTPEELPTKKGTRRRKGLEMDSPHCGPPRIASAPPRGLGDSQPGRRSRSGRRRGATVRRCRSR